MAVEVDLFAEISVPFHGRPHQRDIGSVFVELAVFELLGDPAAQWLCTAIPSQLRCQHA